MSLALCPYCQKKLNLPEAVAAGTAIQCPHCNASFLPPEPVQAKPKKKAKQRQQVSRSGNKTVFIAIMTLIVLALVGIGVYILWKPSVAGFNEQIVKQYQRLNGLLQPGTGANSIVNLRSFLEHFQRVTPQLSSIIKDVKDLQPPDDGKMVHSSFMALVHSLHAFGINDVPDLLIKLKSSVGENAVGSSMAETLTRIAQLHESLIQQQHAWARKNDQILIQPPTGRESFLPRSRR